MESFIEEVLLDTSIVLSDDEFEHLLSSLVGLYFSHWSGEGEGRYPKFVVKEMLDREPEVFFFFFFFLLSFISLSS